MRLVVFDATSGGQTLIRLKELLSGPFQPRRARTDAGGFPILDHKPTLIANAFRHPDGCVADQHLTHMFRAQDEP